MEPTTTLNAWLPYWAVLVTDVRQTLRSWVYRVWVLAAVLAAVGFLLYRVGVYREAGLVQSAAAVLSDLLHWTVVGSVALIVALAGGSIAGERGTLADSILSRGISRYQYFLAKWHARSAAVIGTFLLLAAAALAGTSLLLHEDLSAAGCLVALALVACLLFAIISCGVTVSALTNSTVLGIATLWMVLYGCAFLLSLAPASFPSPDRVLARLPHVLRGHYDPNALGQLMGVSVLIGLTAAAIGMLGFARRDV